MFIIRKVNNFLIKNSIETIKTILKRRFKEKADVDCFTDRNPI